MHTHTHTHTHTNALIHIASCISDMTHSHMWHASFTCFVYTWLDSFTYMPWLILWRDSFTLIRVYVTWLIHICNVTHSYYLCDMTHCRKSPGDAPVNHCNTQQQTATHCNTLQHTATHCNTLQHCNKLIYELCMRYILGINDGVCVCVCVSWY